ncbi:MAG: peroxidase-related enzyme [Xanthomonadales bacterium]|nr:peroxidase-related enzyme [Xanthomonadales bacterium]
MPFIKVIHPESASGRLAKLYHRVSGPGGQVDNVLQIHSLRPHSLEGHMGLYKAVLHHPRNKLPTWFLEAIGVRVSLLNDCSYCAKHHAAGMKRQLGAGSDRFESYRAELEKDRPGEPFSPQEQAALAYAEKLTRDPGAIGPADIAALRAAGLDDGCILEINQVAAYFAYANRTVTGLGVHTEGEMLGLAPDDSPDWHHH